MLTLVGLSAHGQRHEPARRHHHGARRKPSAAAITAGVHPRRDFPRFLDMYAEGRLKLDELVTRRYRLDEINEAYASMLTGAVARGVIVF